MALACLPFLADTLRLAAAAVVLVLAMVLSAGLRRRPARERALDLHRAVGGALMGGMLLVGGHADAVARHAHTHGASVSPHVVFSIAAAAYLVWTVIALARPDHRPRAAAPRVELVAMAAMFTLAGAAMLPG